MIPWQIQDAIFLFNVPTKRIASIRSAASLKGRYVRVCNPQTAWGFREDRNQEGKDITPLTRDLYILPAD